MVEAVNSRPQAQSATSTEEVRQHIVATHRGYKEVGLVVVDPDLASNVHAVVGKDMHQGSDVQPLRQSVINAIVWVISMQSVFQREQQ